jgi:hypothetical protein
MDISGLLKIIIPIIIAIIPIFIKKISVRIKVIIGIISGIALIGIVTYTTIESQKNRELEKAIKDKYLFRWSSYNSG